MLNKKVSKALNIKEEQYLNWCKKMKLPHYKKETKKQYYKIIFQKILKEG